ncbi:ankyrin repeat domain-containing protein [Leptolyngbya sp. AN03gr2]|uniref:ankyrin repeat domain-containing protein n=1 Tax=unclassified Leptolyngbya TaxID=2650499 RepID=UPI003D31B843
MSRTSRWVYALRFLVIPIWGFSAFAFWGLNCILILAWLSLLPEAVASLALILASRTGIIVLICAAIGGSSLLLWRSLPAKQAAGIAVLVPILLWVCGLFFGRVDYQGTDPYVFAPAQRGEVQNTREQLVIKTAQYGLLNELQALIQVGTSVNVRNPKGQSALYWAREPKQVNILLQAGAKPDGASLVEAAFWGRLDTMKLLIAATPDDGKALIAEVGDQALDATTGVITSGEQDRTQIIKLLVDRGAKRNSDRSDRP